MRAELANLNYCAVAFLSRAAVNLCWYYILLLYIVYYIMQTVYGVMCSVYCV